MLVKILGSAAGGGFPQWNCVCPNCSGLRQGSLRAQARTQTQIAFSPLPDVWFLVCASPDLRSQILDTRELHPAQDKPGSPVAGVFLPSADVDAVMGLLHLREFQSFLVFATPAVHRILRDENPIFHVLDRPTLPVQWQTLVIHQRVGYHLSGKNGNAPAFFFTTVPLGANFPDYASDKLGPKSALADASVAFLFEQGEKKLFVAPSLPVGSNSWTRFADSADVALLDGTFWSDDELLASGRTNRTAKEIGHVPLSDPEGLLAKYRQNSCSRKILIHINNTNPVLNEDSPEHARVTQAGFEIAYDGLTFEL